MPTEFLNMFFFVEKVQLKAQLMGKGFHYVKQRTFWQPPCYCFSCPPTCFHHFLSIISKEETLEHLPLLRCCGCSVDVAELELSSRLESECTPTFPGPPLSTCAPAKLLLSSRNAPARCRAENGSSCSAPGIAILAHLVCYLIILHRSTVFE